MSPPSSSPRSGFILQWVAAQQEKHSQQPGARPTRRRRSDSCQPFVGVPPSGLPGGTSLLTPSPTDSFDRPTKKRKARSMSGLEESDARRGEKRLRTQHSFYSDRDDRSSQPSSFIGDSQAASVTNRSSFLSREYKPPSSRTKNPYNWSPRKRLLQNGVRFVSYDQTPTALKQSIDKIIKSYQPSASEAAQLVTRARHICRRTMREQLSEAALITIIVDEILPEFPEACCLCRQQDENFTCKTEPRSSDAVPIPAPRADAIVGYNLSLKLQKKLNALSTKLDGVALLTAEGTLCAQLVVEFKSSFKGGATSAAMNQAAGASATCSNSIAYLHDTLGTATHPDRRAICVELRDCLVFGLVVDEYTAYITATWRVNVPPEPPDEGAAELIGQVTETDGLSPASHSSGDAAAAARDSEAGQDLATMPFVPEPQDQFHFAQVAVFALSLEKDTIAFLEQVEGIKGWIEGRFDVFDRALNMLS